tara:strand:+ start:103 stop:567 length:465 start_codon:yes stop_codon:yes gene_type:complete
MHTRSVTKDHMARFVFEQPPVLDIILRNLEHEDDTLPLTLLERDLVSLRLVFKSPAAVDVIEAHKIRVMQLRLRRRMFLAQITDLMYTDLSDEVQDRREHLYRVLDIIVDNKDLLESPFFASLRDSVRTMIDGNAEECPVFRTRAKAYRTELKI